MKGLDGKIVQICFLVENIDRAIETWVAQTGAGPFFVKKNMHVEVEYRGEPSFIEVSAAFGQGGDVQIELIELHGTNPSVYLDSFPLGQAGFHHVAMFVDDVAKAIEDSGYPVGMRGDFAGTPFAYIDTRETLGFFTEIYQHSDSMHRLYKDVADAARDWDGMTQVRSMDELFG